MWITSFYNHQEYWELYHKITVDYINKIIFVNPDVTTFDVKVDLYSDLKEVWKLPAPDYKFRNFKPPIRVIGGDNTIAGQKAGDIYFMKEGWRVVYDPTKVEVSGVLFSDNFDTPWLYTENMQPVYPALVSSLVTGVDIEAVTAPSATTVASAVRTELNTELTRIDVATSTRASQTSVDAVQTTVDSIETKVDAVIVTLGNMSSVINEMIKYSKNKTIIDPNAHTMTIYDDNGIDPLHVFDLQDADGVASITDIYRRIPQ